MRERDLGYIIPDVVTTAYETIEKYIFVLYRKDTHYATKKGVKSGVRVVQSVRRKGLGRVEKCPDSTPKVSKIMKSRFF